MPKTKAKTKSKRTKARRKSQTMALAAAAPGLRVSRDPVRGTAKAAGHQKAVESVQFPPAARIYEVMLRSSPWNAVLFQQALLDETLLGMLKVQQTFAHHWTRLAITPFRLLRS